MKNYFYPSFFAREGEEDPKLLFSDYLVILAIIIIPTSFLCLVDRKLFYIPGLFDYRFLAVLLTFPLIFFGVDINKFFKLPGSKWFALAALYCVFNFFFSIYRGIAVTEVITAFRGLVYVTSTLCAILYLCSVEDSRLYKITRYIIIITLVQGILLFLACTLRVNFFMNQSRGYKQGFKGATIIQNTWAYPRFFFPVVALLTGMVFFEKKNIWEVLFFLGIMVPLPFLTILRSQSVITVFTIMLIFFLNILVNKHIKGKFGLTLKAFIAVVSIVTVFCIAFPGYTGRYLDKWGFGDKDEKLNSSTLDFRVKIVEEAWWRIKDSRLLGLGYKKSGVPKTVDVGGRNYDYVLGEDTYIAPVIFTEGVLGLFLRIMPILSLLVCNLYRIFQNYEPKLKAVSICVVAVILANCINPVQTDVFVKYNIILFFLYLLEILRYNYLAMEDVDMCCADIDNTVFN